jgi:hypothetical protein
MEKVQKVSNRNCNIKSLSKPFKSPKIPLCRIYLNLTINIITNRRSNSKPYHNSFCAITQTLTDQTTNIRSSFAWLHSSAQKFLNCNALKFFRWHRKIECLHYTEYTTVALAIQLRMGKQVQCKTLNTIWYSAGNFR